MERERDMALGTVRPLAPALERVVAAGADRIAARADAVAVELVRRVREAMPDLPDDEEFEQALLATSRGNVGLITEMARSWTDPHVVPPPWEALQWARSLVGRGVSLDGLLRAYRVAQAAYQEVWYLELRAHAPDPALALEAMQACSAFFFAWVDAISGPLTRAYVDERDRRLRGAEAVRTETIQQLLDDVAIAPELASARLGYELARDHVCVIAWGEPDGREPTREALEGLVREIASVIAAPGNRPLVMHAPLGEVTGWIPRVVAAQSGFDALAPVLREASCSAAFGGAGAGVAGFRRSHEEATRARRTARLLLRGPRATRFEDVEVTDLLTRDAAAAAEFARRTLGPLGQPDDASRRLLATLRVFLEEGGSLVRTSRRLGIHKNTIAYRVRRAQELTGEPPPAALHAAVLLSPLLADHGS